MEIIIDKSNNILGYSLVGTIKNGIEISEDIVPDSDFYDEPTKYCYSKEEGFYINPNYQNVKLKEAKVNKIAELSALCEQTIIDGVTIEDKHYSMALTDQLNLESLKTTIMAGAESVPYHANGESCRLYTAESYLAVYNACALHKISQTTYFNQLRQYVDDLTSTEEVCAVSYGQELTGKYLEAYNQIMDSLGAN